MEKIQLNIKIVEEELTKAGTRLINEDIQKIAWEYCERDLDKLSTEETFQLFQDLINEGINYALEVMKPSNNINFVTINFGDKVVEKEGDNKNGLEPTDSPV